MSLAPSSSPPLCNLHLPFPVLFFLPGSVPHSNLFQFSSPYLFCVPFPLSLLYLFSHSSASGPCSAAAFSFHYNRAESQIPFSVHFTTSSYMLFFCPFIRSGSRSWLQMLHALSSFPSPYPCSFNFPRTSASPLLLYSFLITDPVPNSFPVHRTGTRPCPCPCLHAFPGLPPDLHTPTYSSCPCLIALYIYPPVFFVLPCFFFFTHAFTVNLVTDRAVLLQMSCGQKSTANKSIPPDWVEH